MFNLELIILKMIKMTILFSILILARIGYSTENAPVQNATPSTHWSIQVIDELKTKEFPDKINNVWVQPLRAMDGTAFIKLKYTLKGDEPHNYYERLYTVDGKPVIQQSQTNQITPVSSKIAIIGAFYGKDLWDLEQNKSLGKPDYNYFLTNEKTLSRERLPGEQGALSNELVLENLIGIVEIKNKKSKDGSKLYMAHVLDVNMNIVNKQGPFHNIFGKSDHVYINISKGAAPTFHKWDLTPIDADKATHLGKLREEHNKKTDEIIAGLKEMRQQQEIAAKKEEELKKSNEVCFNQAKASRNFAMAYKCGENLGDTYATWLLDEPEADVDAIGKAIKKANMYYSLLIKLKKRHEILTGLGHKNMKALEMANAADDARRKRDATAAATAKSNTNTGTPNDYNKSYKQIMWEQGVNKGGPTYDQINSGGK